MSIGTGIAILGIWGACAVMTATSDVGIMSCIFGVLVTIFVCMASD